MKYARVSSAFLYNRFPIQNWNFLRFESASLISIESFLHFCSDLQVMCVLEFSTRACNETGKTAYARARFEINFAMVGRCLSLIPTVIKIMLTKIQLVVAYLYSNSFGMFSL